MTKSLDEKWIEAVNRIDRLRVQRDQLLLAAKLALPGLDYLADHSEVPSISSDAQMTANTLRSAILEAEKP